MMRQEDPCPNQTSAATLIIRDSQGRGLCIVSSGEDGHFLVGVLLGSCELISLTEPGGLPEAAPQLVTVAQGRFTDVTVTFDSGIR